jgi:uncharacterized membrane protein
MTIVHTEVEVDAPQDRVWSVVADPRNLPRWDRHIMAVRGVPDGGLQVGTEYVTDLRFMGIASRLRAKVLQLESPRYARIRLTGILDAVVETRLESIRGDRTRLDQRVDFRFVGGPFGAFAASAVRGLGAQNILRRGVIAQKRQAEAG